MNPPTKTPSACLTFALLSAILFNGAPAPAAAPAEFRPAIARLALDRRQALPGQVLQATYTFRSSGPAGSDLTVFVHVVRPDGRHIGADFEPDLPTTEWPKNGFVREGPFPINVPEDAAAGKYEVWVGMFSPDGGERIEINNADRHRGHREYHVGEFEVVAAGGKAEVKPAVFSWLPVDETMIAKTPGPATSANLDALVRLTLSVDRKVLNAVREPGISARLTLTGFYRDGSQRVLRASEAVIKARTRSASGNVAVVSIEGDKVLPRVAVHGPAGRSDGVGLSAKWSLIL